MHARCQKILVKEGIPGMFHGVTFPDITAGWLQEFNRTLEK